MASRGGDGTLKLWDLRAFKKPLAVWDGLDTNYANTTCCFSPDERLLCTGVCARSAWGGRVWCLCLVCANEPACLAMWQPGSMTTCVSARPFHCVNSSKFYLGARQATNRVPPPIHRQG